ncbi:class I SAM-dependent methyltransferase [Labrenzia sp. R4_2]|uniref:class I SAM-dependent DNA methyltransferase n=1 Tax=Labrenzia sp. R4_2 TaxID=2821107 RepID=UPI001AD9B4F2|nr:class I SAM-dependent methyltransferase [Labrenzia sp. R4_2]MBO9420368.1 class I SAM-dependent methyltransferase [Labrenzia sp. R4_2]
MAERNPLLEHALSLNGDPLAIREFYANWVQTYDTDLLLAIGYVAPQVAAETLVRHLGDGNLVLDAGCGTGLVGLDLLKLDYKLTIDGIDLTPEMLAASRKSGAYRKLNEADMCGPLHEIDDDSYDGIVSAGVFTSGHVGPDGLDALIRIAKPGAPIVFTVRDTTWDTDGFAQKIEKLENDGAVRIVDIQLSPYHTKEDVFCQLCVLEVV